MYLSEHLQTKWAGVLDHPDLAPIQDPYKKAVTAVVLENQALEMTKSGEMLSEAVPTNAASAGLGSGGAAGFSGSAAATGPVAGFDPILISLVRRSLPNLIAYDHTASKAKLMALNSICAKACINTARPSAVTIERRFTKPGFTNTGASGRPGMITS